MNESIRILGIINSALLRFLAMAKNKFKVYGIFNYFKFIMGLIFFNEVGNREVVGLIINYKENLEFIQQYTGDKTTLECRLEGLVKSNDAAHFTFNWYFKECEAYEDLPHCVYNQQNWKKLPCQDSTCKPELHLKNVTEKHSDLYKCAAIPKVDNVIGTFQLNIKNSSSKIPKFIGLFPLNETISEGSQVVFECRVYSDEYPIIKWFHRLSNFKYGRQENLHSAVNYNGQVYQLLLSEREKRISGNIYLSKLIINDAKPQDEGFYACVAINSHGHYIQESYLKVYVSDDDFKEYWSDYSTEDELLIRHTREFSLLFLMLVGLALLPLSVWLGHIIHKRCQSCSLKMQNEECDEYCIVLRT